MNTKTKPKTPQQTPEYTRVAENYTLQDGTVIELLERLPKIILHPQQYRELKSKQENFNFLKRQDIAARNAPIPAKVLTQAELDDERYNAQLLENKKQKKAQKEREELASKIALQHQEYLQSKPLIAMVSNHSFTAFIHEVSHRLQQGYTLQTCDAIFPSLFQATFTLEKI
jgi:hypothetical protein